MEKLHCEINSQSTNTRLVEDNVAVEATSLVEQGRYVDALDLVFPSGYNPTLEI